MLVSVVIIRILLMFMACLVLSFSATLAAHQVIGQIPAETIFVTFVGGTQFTSALLGMFALGYQRFDMDILMGVDLLGSAFYLTGAIVLTVAMNDVPSCDTTDPISQHSRSINKIISGGCENDPVNGLQCPYAISANGTDLTMDRCQTAVVDYSFQYLACILALAAFGIAYFDRHDQRVEAPFDD
ncbi:hypothetical protein F4861DRAFT_17568 [Xylaria intraflava]|nr:hypothetical protein F4861DRAFT_17568 [Xylaria intraflava]